MRNVPDTSRRKNKKHTFYIKSLFPEIHSVYEMLEKYGTAREATDDNIQDVSRLVDITAGGDFLGLCDKKKVHIYTCVRFWTVTEL